MRRGRPHHHQNWPRRQVFETPADDVVAAAVLRLLHSWVLRSSVESAMVPFLWPEGAMWASSYPSVFVVVVAAAVVVPEVANFEKKSVLFVS